MVPRGNPSRNPHWLSPLALPQVSRESLQRQKSNWLRPTWRSRERHQKDFTETTIKLAVFGGVPEEIRLQRVGQKRGVHGSVGINARLQSFEEDIPSANAETPIPQLSCTLYFNGIIK